MEEVNLNNVGKFLIDAQEARNNLDSQTLRKLISSVDAIGDSELKQAQDSGRLETLQNSLDQIKQQMDATKDAILMGELQRAATALQTRINKLNKAQGSASAIPQQDFDA